MRRKGVFDVAARLGTDNFKKLSVIRPGVIVVQPLVGFDCNDTAAEYFNRRATVKLVNDQQRCAVGLLCELIGTVQDALANLIAFAPVKAGCDACQEISVF